MMGFLSGKGGSDFRDDPSPISTQAAPGLDKLRADILSAPSITDESRNELLTGLQTSGEWLGTKGRSINDTASLQGSLEARRRDLEAAIRGEGVHGQRMRRRDEVDLVKQSPGVARQTLLSV